jgi:hypothetical protein
MPRCASWRWIAICGWNAATPFSPAGTKSDRPSAPSWRTATAIISPTTRRSTGWKAKGLVAFRYATPAGEITPEANLNGSARSIAGISVLTAGARRDAAPRGSGRSADGRHRRQAAVRLDRGRLMPRPERDVNQELAREFGLSAEEYARVLDIMGRTPHADRTRRVQRHVVGTLQLQIVPRLAEAVADQTALGDPRPGRERRRGRYRRRPGRDLQDGKPQPPELHRALPGRRHRRRRHPARRVHHGRAPDRQPERAALRQTRQIR